MPTANLGIGSGLTSTLGTGTGTANLGTGSGLVADLKDPGAAAATYGTEYQAVYDSLTTKPSDEIALVQNTMVVALVAAGIWAKLDVFYVFAQTTNGAGEALKNWILPGTYDATAYNAPTFAALEGFTAGPLKYIDTNWNPNTNGVNYTLNACSAGTYLRTDQIASTADFGVQGGTNQILLQTNTAGYTYIRVNGSSSNLVACSDSRGLFIIRRSTSILPQCYRNGSIYIDGNRVSTSIPNFNMYVLAKNVEGSATLISSRQNSMFFAGGLLSEGEITAFTNAFEAYMDSNGKGII